MAVRNSDLVVFRDPRGSLLIRDGEEFKSKIGVPGSSLPTHGAFVLVGCSPQPGNEEMCRKLRTSTDRRPLRIPGAVVSGDAGEARRARQRQVVEFAMPYDLANELALAPSTELAALLGRAVTVFSHEIHPVAPDQPEVRVLQGGRIWTAAQDDVDGTNPRPAAEGGAPAVFYDLVTTVDAGDRWAFIGGAGMLALANTGHVLSLQLLMERLAPVDRTFPRPIRREDCPTLAEVYPQQMTWVRSFMERVVICG